MNVNGLRQDRDEGDKDLLLFAHLPRYAKISSSVRVQTQATIFSRSCPRKAFAKQQRETVFAGALGKYILAECNQADRHVTQCKDRCHSVKHDGVRHAKLPHLNVKNHEDDLHLGCSWSENFQHEPCI